MIIRVQSRTNNVESPELLLRLHRRARGNSLGTSLTTQEAAASLNLLELASSISAEQELTTKTDLFPLPVEIREISGNEISLMVLNAEIKEPNITQDMRQEALIVKLRSFGIPFNERGELDLSPPVSEEIHATISRGLNYIDWPGELARNFSDGSEKFLQIFDLAMATRCYDPKRLGREIYSHIIGTIRRFEHEEWLDQELIEEYRQKIAELSVIDQSFVMLPEPPILRYSGRIERNSTEYEAALTPLLSQMPNLTIRGQADRSRNNLYSFLIPGERIEGIVSSEALTPANFFSNLYATVNSALGYGLRHLHTIEGSREMLVAIHSTQRKIHRDDMFLGADMTDVAEEQFPTYNRGHRFIGQIRFTKEQLPADPKNLRDRRNLTPIVYNQVLRLMVKIAERSWFIDSTAV